MSFTTRNVIVCGDGYCLVDHKSTVCCSTCPKVKDCEEKCEPMKEDDALRLCTYQVSIKTSQITRFKPTGENGLRYHADCDACGEVLAGGEENYYTYEDNKYCEVCYSEIFFTCGYCEEVTSQEEQRFVRYKEYDICNDCYNNYFDYCVECAELYHIDDMDTNHKGDKVCDSCMSSLYTTCDDCGESWKTQRMNTSDIEREELCSTCWERKVIQCAGCGSTGDKDNMNELNNEMWCDGCYEEEEEAADEEEQEESQGGN